MKTGISIAVAFSALALAAGSVLGQTSQGTSPATPSTPSTPKPDKAPKRDMGTPSGSTAQSGATRDSRAGGKVTFTSLDANNDSVVSKAEAEAAPEVSKMFGKLDKNKDGRLSQSEFSAHSWK